MEDGEHLPAAEQEDENKGWVPMPGNDTPLPGENEEIPYDYEINEEVDSLSDGDLSFSDSEEERECVSKPDEKISWGDQVRLIHLRRFIDELAENVQQKEYAVQKYREEVKKCKFQIKTLEDEKEQVCGAIHTAESDSNTSAVYRLRAQFDRIIKEIENEDELLVKVESSMEKAEYELAQSQVEQGKMLLEEDDLVKQEGVLKKQQKTQADTRALKESEYATKAVALKLQHHRMAVSAVEYGVRRQQKAMDGAKRSQEKHNKYLQDTVAKLRQREVDEEARQKEHMERRMETMMALKNDIMNNRENLRALQARDKALAQKKANAEEKWKRDIEAAGGNPTEEMLKQKRIQEFEAKNEAHRIKQEEGQVKIATKLLAEEDRVQQRKRQQPLLFQNPQKEKEKIVKPHPRPKLTTLERAANPPSTEISYEIDLSKFEGKTGDESGDESMDYTPLTITRENTALLDTTKQAGESESLAKPEFEGMWDQHKPYKVSKDLSSGPQLPGATKMEREIMGRVLDKQREGIIIKQVAGGKEFKGRAFYSKPDVIHFKDFEVGKAYKKKVTLTNVSYTVNYCKLMGLTEHLKDFITLHFDPPGQMSAGLTCDLIVTFKPMINEDLEGEVRFLAQTGPFSIAVRCTTKKCDLSVDKNMVDFGTSVIGETLYRSFTLTNKGALATKYDFFKITGLKQRTVTSPGTSLGCLTTADTNRGAVSPDFEEGLKKGKVDAGKKKEAAAFEKQDEEGTEKKDEKDGQLTERTGKCGSDGDGEGTKGDGEDTLQVTGDLSFSDDGMDIGQTDMDDLYSLDGIKVGQVSEGEIGPFSSVKLDIVWQPTIPGKVETEFVVSFEDLNSDNISIQCVASAIDVPVWVERQTVDLKICMLDRLYQDTILVSNRATTALRLKFEVCKELQNHMELLPKTGYIQAQSQFSAQLKFLPRKSLFTEAGNFFDKDTGVLGAPMTIRVADQTRPVPFTVHAVVTISNLEFSATSIDFGCCTIYEDVKSNVTLTNHSILPQQFGFVGIPDYVDVQPNDGFGTLLPLETIELDIIFLPKKAREYSFELTCKSLINREFKITCRGVGVHPPMELSHQILHFQATALNDVSTVDLHVINSHTSMNEFTHPVPRIGRGEIAPVNLTSFEFLIPQGSPISISPSVGTVDPGGRCHVHVGFTPQLENGAVRKEAVKMLTKMLEAQAQEEYKAEILREKEKQEDAAKKPVKGKPSPKGRSGANRGSESSASLAAKGPPPIQVPEEDSIDPNSDEYAAAKASLLRTFKGGFQSFTIPCYIASGQCTNPGELPYSIHNTLYLEVHCPTVKPQLVVISDNGRTCTDFGEVSIGQQVIKSITIQNISDKHIDLRSSLLDPEGPFQMLNSLRVLSPQSSHMVLICFTPHKGQMFQEMLEIHCPNSCLYLTLKGQGVSPMVTLSVKEGVMDLGAVIAAEYKEETFKIVNTSTLSVHYCIKLDSQSLLRHVKAQGIPPFIKPNTKFKSLVGTQNNNGQQVFDCIPAEGVIPAGGNKEVMVTFSPDHASDNYSDGCRVELFGEEESHVFVLRGESKERIMYLSGGDKLVPEVESLSVPPALEADDDGKVTPTPLLVTLHSVAKGTEFSTTCRELFVGCVRTMAVSQKKNGEWYFDNLATITPLGFTIDPVKGMIEAGTRRPINITWTPPATGYDPSKPMEASIQCTLKGDVTEVFRIMLRGLVVSE